MSQLTRHPLSEDQMAIIESQFYPDWHPPIRIEGIGLDIRMEYMKLNESNTQWLRRQARSLHREFVKKQ